MHVVDPAPVQAFLQERLGEGVLEVHRFRGDPTVLVRPEALLDALAAVKGDPWRFEMLTDLTAWDRYPTEPRFEVVYHLLSLSRRERLRVKTRVPGSDPVLPTAIPLFAGANWFERELWDLFGIRFVGHPDLTRILLPDDWEGHPLRKDYPLTEEPVEFKGYTPKVPSETIPNVPPRRREDR
ncbi:MAG: NADH-quinone oxidoreductase subunit C [Armatimonadota bacterium]|nr:NADH-quinone oxidoreductase subunit C [Armatimonadota bacterium]MDR7443625.1 NADH-quinone oxidoreductase subunit C [Armatimonadota bacterium]MDR7570200.1 NADH-quinone oxidoreductase subunit C [Armatimonadota bacterium]MDR7613845.1 NADH-quinone oxidoreductase subunit C [Armatimonadota bacterium]